MPLVKPRLLNLLTLTSLLLSATALTMWTRSEWRSDMLLRTKWWTAADRAGHYRLWAESNDGLLTLGYFARSYPSDAKDWPEYKTRAAEYDWTSARAHDAPHATWSGFAYNSDRVPALAYPGNPITYYDVGRTLTLPFWFFAIALGSVPTVRLLTRLRASKPPHLCPHCRYDLRATPDRCPECGAVPNPAHT
jgi:hypothetical protein